MRSVLSRRRFIGTAGVSAMTLASGRRARARQVGEEGPNVALVNAMVAAVSTRDMNAVLKYLAPDCVYRLTETTPPATGHEEIRARLEPALERAERVEWEIVETYAKGPMVVNHRIDRFLGGTRPFTWEGVGIFFVREGAIKEWQDFTIRLTR